MQRGRRWFPSCGCRTCGSDERMTRQLESEIQNPQASYWRHTWGINGGSGWTLSGHSRALERTGFVIEELGVYLDAGVGWRNPTTNPEAILVTHGHIDHVNALPMLLRCGDADPAVFVPLEHVNNVREMARMTWSVKREDHSAGAGSREDVANMPEFITSLVEKSRSNAFDGDAAEAEGAGTGRGDVRFQWQRSTEALPVEQGAVRDYVPDKAHLQGVKGRMWVPSIPGIQYLLPGKKRTIIRTVHCFHTTTDVGYVVCELSKVLKGKDEEADAEYRRLKDIARTDKSAGKLIGEMRKQGRLVNHEEIVPVVAYLCDTTAQVLGPCGSCAAGRSECEYVVEQFSESCFGYLAPDRESCAEPAAVARVSPNLYAEGSKNPNGFTHSAQAALIFQCPTIVIECSFVGAAGMGEREAAAEAKARGHASWGELEPFVRRNPKSVFVLVHFSKRYTDAELIAYFEQRLGFEPASQGEAAALPQGEAARGPGDHGGGEAAVVRNVVLFLDSGVIDFRDRQPSNPRPAGACLPE